MVLSISSTPTPQVALKQCPQAPRQPNWRDCMKLRRIYRARHGGGHFVADDEAGRNWVIAFLLCGFRGKQLKALKADAPWLTDDELAALRQEARSLIFDDIGLLIRLTDEECTRWKAWRFFPWHVAPSEKYEWLRERQREQRRVASRKYYWKKRSEQAQRCKGDLRIDAIMRMVDAGPLSVPELTKRARSLLFWPKGSKSMFRPTSG
jgi:hypothetical protein